MSASQDILDSYEKYKLLSIFKNEFDKFFILGSVCLIVSVCPADEYLQNFRRNPSHECKEVSLGELKHHVFFYHLRNKWKLIYEAFCSGSIISEERVLTSAHCFLTNRKRIKRSYSTIRVVGGILVIVAQQPVSHDIQQWRSIDHLYSQRFFRFPAYNLAIAKVDKPWTFNQYVNKIPYTKWDQDFDGICMGIGLKTSTSFLSTKQLHTIGLTLIKRRTCERTLLRSCYLYYCTKYETLKLTSTEAEGAGLICRGTGDPLEDEKLGVLVGVTSLINIDLPSLHNKVGVHYKWVTDSQPQANLSPSIVLVIILIKLINLL